jgi:ABC-type multidrug transport system fused ATPase/permease subunit
MNMIQNISNAKTPGWFSEPKNLATTIVGLALAAALAYGFFTYVLPWLVNVTWNLVNLLIGGLILGFLLLLVSNRKFWRALRYFSEFLANYTIGLAIELNPFAILQARIDQGYSDRNMLYKQTVKLKGKQSELLDKLKDKDSELQLNIRKVKVLQAEGGPSRQVDLYANNVLRCQEYIDNVTPIVGDLNKLIAFADGAYEESGLMLEDAKLDLEAKKDLYYSVTTGMSAVTSAMRAFKGDDELNRDADRALALLKAQISEKIGHIKSAIDVTARFMDDRVLEDKAKAAQVLELINGFDSQKDFHYGQQSLDRTKDGGRLRDVKINDRYRGLLE